MKNNIPNDSLVHNGGCVDDDGKGGAASEMRQDLLNHCQVRDDGCVDEDVVLCSKW